MEKKLEIKLRYLEKAIFQLEEMINEPVGSKRAEIDSAIRRFKFCFELFWKTLKLALEILGQNSAFPKEVLKAAYQGGLIGDEQIWLHMLKDRNDTSHIYDKDVADQVYNNIKTRYFGVIKKSFTELKCRDF